jgi:hypothetical protein
MNQDTITVKLTVREWGRVRSSLVWETSRAGGTEFGKTMGVRLRMPSLKKTAPVREC